MNYVEFVREIGAKTGYTQKDIKEVLDGAFNVLGDQMMEGSFVNVPGFGKFTSRACQARTGRNPMTGESIQIAAKHFPKFVPAKALKAKVNA